MSGYETPFQKYFVIAGMIFVLITAVSANWMKDQIALDQAKARAMRRFKQYKEYDVDKYLPQIKIAGPEGTMVDLLDGKHYTVLNIWATWCTPCVNELSSLKHLNHILSYEKKWRVVAVSIDLEKDIEKVASYTKKLKVRDIASYHDINKDLQRSVNIKGLPMTMILDKRGKILYEIYGTAIWYDSDIVSLLRFISNSL